MVESCKVKLLGGKIGVVGSRGGGYLPVGDEKIFSVETCPSHSRVWKFLHVGDFPNSKPPLSPWTHKHI